MWCKVKDLKKGDFFTLKECGVFPPLSLVYVRMDYDRSERKYLCERFSDLSDVLVLERDRLVWAGFYLRGIFYGEA